MNSDAFRDHHRERKARCFERTIDALVRTGQIAASEDELSDAVAGLSDAQWKLVADLANATHDCGVSHGVPSFDAQLEVVNLFTDRALRAAKVEDVFAAELERRAARINRPLRVLS